jgi:hypothetical protein
MPQPDPCTVARERFERDTANHQMTVLHDDGLYRHLRFSSGGSFYWYEIVTWPGRLTVAGDVETFTFARTEDMFDFFGNGTDPAGEPQINPHYWAQKIDGPGGGQNLARIYTHEALRDRVLSWAEDHCSSGEGAMIYPSLLTEALEREVLYGYTNYEGEGYERLGLLEDAVGYMDCWEWDLKQYDWAFLWCCWAIVSAIGQYRAATAQPMVTA